MDNYIDVEGQTAKIQYKDGIEGSFHIFENFCIDNQPRKVQIFIPPKYDDNRKYGYPVIYMNDGQTTFEPGGLSPWCWEVDKTLNRLYKENAVKEVIIVAVTPTSRADEYLNVTQILDFDNNIMNLKGDLPNYADYLANKLKPFIDYNYNTAPRPEQTTIIGSSFGGSASFYISCMHPDAFGIAGVCSPSFFIATGLQVLHKPIEQTDYMQSIFSSLNSCKKKPKLWIDWGKQEGNLGEYSLEVIKLLKEKQSYKENENLFYMEDEIATHDERAWAYRFGLFVKQFYSKV